MAGTTTPDNLPYPDNGDLYNPTADIQALAEGVQAALDNRAGYSYRWDDSSGRTAETGMRVGDLGYQVDTDTLYRYDGTSWQVWVVTTRNWTPTFTNLTLGAATVIGSYEVTNGRCTGFVAYQGGSGASATGTVDMSLPVSSTLPENGVAGLISYKDVSDGTNNVYLSPLTVASSSSSSRLMRPPGAAPSAAIAGMYTPMSSGSGTPGAGAWSYSEDTFTINLDYPV